MQIKTISHPREGKNMRKLEREHTASGSINGAAIPADVVSSSTCEHVHMLRPRNAIPGHTP